MIRKLSVLALLACVIGVINGCSADSRTSEDAACLSSCSEDSTLTAEQKFQCQSTCADNAMLRVAGTAEQSASSTESLDTSNASGAKAETITQLPSMSDAMWSYVSTAGYVILSAAIIAVAYCYGEPSCLVAVAATTGYAAYQYKKLITSYASYNTNTGLVNAIKGLSVQQFNNIVESIGGNMVSSEWTARINPLGRILYGTHKLDDIQWNQRLFDEVFKQYDKLTSSVANQPNT